MISGSLKALLALGYLTVFGSILAFSAYMFLLRTAAASHVSTHAYVNPLIAVGLGAVTVDEPITASIIIASVVIASGVAVVLGAATPRKPVRQDEPVWQPTREAVSER